MIRETWHNGRRVAAWDEVARTELQWNDTGQQIAQRALSAAENALVDGFMADQQTATNQAAVDANLNGLITSLLADVTQDNSIVSGANPIIASTGTLSSATLSANVRSLAQAVKTLALNDINNKRAFANALRKIQGNYTDLTGT